MASEEGWKRAEDLEGGEEVIFVLPTAPGKPTTAVVGVVVKFPEGGGDGQPFAALLGTQLAWSQDLGMWMTVSGEPVEPELAEDLNERCRELEVPGF